MIELRYESGVSYWINPDHILRIETAHGEDRTGAIVYMVTGEKFRCRETPGEIVALTSPPMPPKPEPQAFGPYAGAVAGSLVGGAGGYAGSSGGGAGARGAFILAESQLPDQLNNG